MAKDFEPVYEKRHQMSYYTRMRNGYQIKSQRSFKELAERDKEYKLLSQDKRISVFKFWSEMHQVDVKIVETKEPESTQISIFDILGEGE